MSTIDEAINDLIRATGSHVVGASSSDDVMRSAGELQALITKAIAEARADGAREMRTNAGDEAARAADQGLSASVVHMCIRALPLPTGERQAVRLTDERLEALADKVFDLIQDEPDDDVGGWDRVDRMFGRAIETAILAANGLKK